MKRGKMVEENKPGIPPILPVIVLLDGADKLLGYLDSNKKKFLVMQGAEMPIGRVSEMCRYPDQEGTLKPTIYLNNMQATEDMKIMAMKVKQLDGGQGCQVRKMGFTVKQ